MIPVFPIAQKSSKNDSHIFQTNSNAWRIKWRMHRNLHSHVFSFTRTIGYLDIRTLLALPHALAPYCSTPHSDLPFKIFQQSRCSRFPPLAAHASLNLPARCSDASAIALITTTKNSIATLIVRSKLQEASLRFRGAWIIRPLIPSPCAGLLE